MKLIAFVFAFVCWLMCGVAFGQGIKLGDIAKIEFASSSPFWVGASLHVVEVLPEGNAWNSYQLARYKQFPNIRDSTRKFAKAIPVKDLKQLLTCINKPDTVLKFERFKVSTKELKRNIDTIQRWAKGSLQFSHNKGDSVIYNLTAEQKAYFQKIIESKQAVKEASLAVMRPLIEDDRSYYGMLLTYKDKHKDTVYAYVNSDHLYHLPWQFKNIPNYNPHITELFDFMMGDNQSAKRGMSAFATLVDDQLSRRWLITKISWDEYKLRHPSNYSALSKTLQPAYIYAYGQSGYFKSSLLPYQGWDLSRSQGWLLLPDGKMVLIFCSDDTIKDGDKIFSTIPLVGKNNRRTMSIVFDQKGRKIGGGQSPFKIETP